MNIHNNNLIQEISVIKKIIENNWSNRIFVESKTVVNNNQNIGFNIMNFNKKYCIKLKKLKKV
jgi:hypothetical protein